MKGLTKRQSEIVKYIKNFIEDHNYSPSYREIGNFFGFSSLGSVHKHVSALKKKGLLQSEKKFSRSMSLTLENAEKVTFHEVELPLIGQISTGFSIQTYSQTQMVTIPHTLVHAPEKSYVLRAKGDSLSEEMIAEGDLLIVEARQEAHPGETVVALINQRDIIVKRYYPEDNYVRLLGNHPNQQPIILRLEDIQIQGVLIGLVRHYG